MNFEVKNQPRRNLVLVGRSQFTFRLTRKWIEDYLLHLEQAGRTAVTLQGYRRNLERLYDPPPKDYIGKRFGRLTVTEYAGREHRCTEKSRATITLWKCRCDCGKEVTVPQPELQSGESQSCGCYMKDRIRESLRLVDGTSVTILETVRSGKPRQDNKTGHTGVCRLKNGYYQATITFKKKSYYLGRYKDIKDAIRAREAAEEIHDDFLTWYYENHSPKRSKEINADMG